MSTHGVHTLWRAPGAEPCRYQSDEPPFHALDPGIRETVRLLWRAGFNPTDSGDGVTKPEDERSVEGPHVFMVVRDRDRLTHEAERLQDLLARLDVSITHHRDPFIQASYDPANGLAVIMLLGVDDKMLGLGGE